MQQHDVDLELPSAQKRAGAKEAGETISPVVSRAIEEGRADRLTAHDMLRLQRTAGNAGVSALVAQREEESPVKDVVHSSGSPLDRDTRSFMESRFGHDFGDVQVHTGGAASASAQAVQAQAYTVGSHVVFGDGKYNPGTTEGDRTLAHELTHVVQQRNGPVDGTPAAGGISVSDPSDRFEQEAEHTAATVMSSPAGPVGDSGAGAARAGSVQREAAGPDEDEDRVQGLALQREAAGPDEDEDRVQGLALQREAAGPGETDHEDLAG